MLSLEADGREEVVDPAIADDVQAQQHRKLQEEQQPQELLVPPPADRSPQGGDGDVVALVDSFAELEGGRPRYSCVVHDTLSAGPTPYNDSWEWQKKVTSFRFARLPAVHVPIYYYW